MNSTDTSYNRPGPAAQAGKHRHKALISILLVFILLTAAGCGADAQTLLVGHWELTKVLVGDKEYAADEFLDPTAQNDSSFVLQVYGDGTLVSTGSLGTEKGSSDGDWETLTDDTYSLEIDGTAQTAKLVGEMLFMEINSGEIPMTLVFEKKKI